MQKTTLFNIQFFVSILGFIGVTAWYPLPFSGMHDEWGLGLLITIALDILFVVLALVYKKIRYRTYKESSLFMRTFWVISLLWLLFLVAFILVSTVVFIQERNQEAKFRKQAEQRHAHCTNVLAQQGINISQYSVAMDSVIRECYLEYELIDDIVPRIVNINKDIVSVGEELVITGENLVIPSTATHPPAFRPSHINQTLTITNSGGATAYIHNSVDDQIYTYTESTDGQLRAESTEFYPGKEMRFRLLDSYCLSRINIGTGMECPSYLKITPGNYTLQIKYWGGLESNEVEIVVK